MCSPVEIALYIIPYTSNVQQDESNKRGASSPRLALTSVIIANLHTSVCFGECGGLHLSLRVKWEMLVYNF